MVEILNNSVWQFVGVLIGVASIVIPIILYLIQRTKKALSYSIISSTPLLKTSLLHPDINLKGRIEILFMGKAVQNVHLLLVKIFNSGNAPITAKDYERPISINFGKESQILSAIISKRTPNDINVSTSIEKNKIILNEVLLNKGDSVEFTILTNKYDGEINVDGRIAGVNKIKYSEEKFTLIKYLFGLGIILFLFVGAIVAISISTGYVVQHSTELLSLIVPLLMVGLFIFMIPILYIDLKNRDWQS